MEKEQSSGMTSREPSQHPIGFRVAESGVIRYASSREEENSESDDITQNQWNTVGAQSPQPAMRSPIASGSSCSAQPETLFCSAEGRFTQCSRSSQQAVSTHKRIRLSDVGSLRSESFSSGFASLTTSVHEIPPSFSRYSDLTRACHLAVQKAVDAVRIACESVYGDQIELWTELMVAAVKDAQIPHHPQATLARMLELNGETLKDDFARLVKFACLLPGFLDLSARDRKILLSGKYLISSMMQRAKFMYRGELYAYLVGPERVQSGTYYMEAIGVDPEFPRFLFRSAETLNDVGLTLTETYMLLAVAIFAPDNARVSDKNTLGYLHAYYLDALFYSLGCRLTIADRALAYYKLEKIMEQFAVIDKISINFINDLDLSRVPLRPRSIATFVELLRK